MKIAFVLRYITEKGSSKYAVEVIRRMLKKGHEVHVFANKWDNIEGVRFHKIPVLPFSFYAQELSFMLLSTLIVNFQRRRFDSVYSQPGRFFSPDIAGVHICATGGAGKPRVLANKVLYEMEKFNLNRAKKIIAISNAIKKELMENYRVPEEKIAVIYNGVNTEKFSLKNMEHARDKTRKGFGIKKGEALLLFVGNPFSRKGLEYAIRALPQIEKAKLLVIGRHDNIAPYLELAEKLGVKEKIIYKEFVEKIQECFAASDAFLFPTLYEPFGLVITEAMASGLPVITSKAAGAAELIKDGKSGLLLDNPKDPGEIAEKANMLIKDKSLANKIKKEARCIAEEYDWDKAAEKWIDVFEELKNKKE